MSENLQNEFVSVLVVNSLCTLLKVTLFQNITSHKTVCMETKNLGTTYKCM